MADVNRDPTGEGPGDPAGCSTGDRAAERAALRELETVATSVATRLAELVERMRGGSISQVATKTSGTDVVTEADTAAERLARDLLGQLRPGESVLGEEEGGSSVAAGELCWVIDPVDGTVNYLYGLPWYAVSVAAQRDGESLAGAVVHPPSGRTWRAAQGLGAECDGVPLTVSDVGSLDQSLLGTGFSYRAERRRRQAAMIAALLPEVRDIRRAGSAALDLCSVASGWFDGYAEHGLKRWDWAAAALIAREAGAVVRLPGQAGCDTGLGDLVVAAAPGIADELLALLRRSGAATV